MARYHEQLHETHHYQIHSLMPAENNDCTIMKEKKIQDKSFVKIQQATNGT